MDVVVASVRIKREYNERKIKKKNNLCDVYAQCSGALSRWEGSLPAAAMAVPILVVVAHALLSESCPMCRSRRSIIIRLNTSQTRLVLVFFLILLHSVFYYLSSSSLLYYILLLFSALNFLLVLCPCNNIYARRISPPLPVPLLRPSIGPTASLQFSIDSFRQ